MARRFVLGGLLALTLGGCGGGGGTGASVTTHTRATASGGPPVSAAVVPPTGTHAASLPPPPPPDIRRLQARLSAELRKAGPATGALVYDLTAHQRLFGLRADVRRPPASVEKLYTTVALLQRLGPGARLETAVLGAGHLGPQGIWHGDLYLRGGGDPTFGDGAFNRVWELGYGPTAAELAGQLAARGIRRVTGHVIGDESLFDTTRGGPATGMAPDIPDFGGQLSALTYDHGSTSGPLSPAAFAARQLARTLRSQRIRARASTLTRATPPDAVPLATVLSPPLTVLLRLMDVPSDDLFAEMLTKQLGVRFGSGGTIAAGAQVIGDVIASYGLHPTIVDGSGLSRDDSSSPSEVVALLKAVRQTAIGDELSASLAVVGVSGTVQGIARRTPAEGHCQAKTGTLTGVTNLAGYCDSRNHHRLAFAVFVDGPSNWQAFVLLSRTVATIAGFGK